MAISLTPLAKFGLALLLSPPAQAPAPAPEPPPAEAPDVAPSAGPPLGEREPSTQPDPPSPPSAAVASFDFTTAPGRRPEDSYAALRTQVPGLALHSLGGLGLFGAVALQGTLASQVPVYLDGAPLTASLSGVVDIADLPVDALDRADLYRGHIPIGYGSGAIGSALDLRGRVHEGAPRLWASGGLGNLRTRAARGGFAVALRPQLSLTGRVGYQGSRGDYSFFDTGGTPLLFGDDRHRRRHNNYYDRGFAQLRVDHRGPRTALSSQLFGWWRHSGVPNPAGLGAAPARADLRTASLRSVSNLRHRILDGRGAVQMIASIAGEGRRYRDPDAAHGPSELGPGNDDERGLSLDLWLSPQVTLPLWTKASLTLSGVFNGQWVRIDERSVGQDPGAASASGDARRRRYAGRFGVELVQRLYHGRWALIPGLHVDLIDSKFDLPPAEAGDTGRDTRTLGFSPRLATTFALHETLELGGSVGRYLRTPTMLELFGDRGYRVGNENLRPEAGTRLDASLRLSLSEPGGRDLELSAQITGFVSWSDDLIQQVHSEGLARAVNIESARQRGLELGASLRALRGDLGLDLAYALLDTLQSSEDFAQRGELIPGRPRHRLMVRPSGGHHFERGGRRGPSLEPRAFYSLEFVSGNTLDLLGREAEAAARVLHTLGASLRIADRLELGIEGRGLAGQRVATIVPVDGWPGPYPVAASDSMGFPLPGRSVWATLRVDLRVATADRARVERAE